MANQWRSPNSESFLFSVQALAALFRGKFWPGSLRCLRARELQPARFGNSRYLPTVLAGFSLLYTKPLGPLLTKRPFGGPQQVGKNRNPSLVAFIDAADVLAHDWRRTNVQAIPHEKLSMLRPAPRLDACVSGKTPLGLSVYTAFFVSSAKARPLGPPGVLSVPHTSELMDLFGKS